MATDLTNLAGRIQASLRFSVEKALDLSTPRDDFASVITQLFTFGTAANQANQLWHDSRSLAEAASETLDLAGSLVSAFGGTVAFATIKAILFRNTGSGAFTIGAATENTFVGPFGSAADSLVIPAGGIVLLTAPAAGWVVTADSGDLLAVTNEDVENEQTYDIVLLGVSA